VLCVLTHRRLQPGTYDEFRAAWQPNEWWPAFRSGYHLRSAERLRRMAPFQLSAKLGGVYEVVEEISPSSAG
jgi:hypothetical protein